MTTLAAHAPPVHAPAPGRHRTNNLGLWLFIGSESYLFAAFIAARFYLLGLRSPDELNQTLGLGITAVLLLSSLTAYRAEAAMTSGRVDGFLRNTAATIGLGMLFLAGVIVEWSEALHAFPAKTLYGSVFFTITGLHAFHVVTGMLVLVVVRRMARRGTLTPANPWPAEAAVKYWHFVDVAWIFIFPTLYLVS